MPILGEYPCCNGSLQLWWSEEQFGYKKEKCPHCGEIVWHHYSNWDPESWTEEIFLKLYEVDDKNKKIIPKGYNKNATV